MWTLSLCCLAPEKNGISAISCNLHFSSKSPSLWKSLRKLAVSRDWRDRPEDCNCTQRCQQASSARVWRHSHSSVLIISSFLLSSSLDQWNHITILKAGHYICKIKYRSLILDKNYWVMTKITLKWEPRAQSTFRKKKKQSCNINSHFLCSKWTRTFCLQRNLFPQYLI